MRTTNYIITNVNIYANYTMMQQKKKWSLPLHWNPCLPKPLQHTQKPDHNFTWWSHLFVVEPTADQFTCHQKNVNNKPWHGMSTTLYPMTIRPAQQLQTTPYPLPHSSCIVPSEKRGHGWILQQQPNLASSAAWRNYMLFITLKLCCLHRWPPCVAVTTTSFGSSDRSSDRCHLTLSRRWSRCLFRVAWTTGTQCSTASPTV